MMKLIYTVLLSALIFFSVSCSDDDDGQPIEDKDDEKPLVGTYAGVSFEASLASGIADGALSGSLILKNDGSYSSTIHPFDLIAEEGSWTYYEEDGKLFFNEGETSEEVAEDLLIKGDSLFFEINRGEPTELTSIDFVLIKQ